MLKELVLGGLVCSALGGVAWARQDDQPADDAESGKDSIAWSVKVTCACIPNHGQFVANESETGGTVPFQSPFYPSREARDEACAAHIAGMIFECRHKIIDKVVAKVRTSCDLSQKVDEECSSADHCRAVDTHGMPTPGSITITQTPKCAERAAGNPPQHGFRVMDQAKCAFTGTVTTLCDP